MARRKKLIPYCNECPHCLGNVLAPNNPPCPQCNHCTNPPQENVIPAAEVTKTGTILREIDLDAPVERPSYTIAGMRYEIKESADLSPADWVEINKLIRETSTAFDGVDTNNDDEMLVAINKLDRLNRRMVIAITYDEVPSDVLESMTMRQIKNVSDFFSRITLEQKMETGQP